MERNVPIGPTWSNLVERIESVQQYSNLVVGWAANTGLGVEGRSSMDRLQPPVVKM